jgi:hypothetical protein
MVHRNALILFLGIIVLCLGVAIASFVAPFAMKLKHVKTCQPILGGGVENPMVIVEPSNGVKNAMVIVEPRKHKLLQPVIENFHQNMDETWDLYVFHGKSHAEHAKAAVKNIKSNSRNVYLKPLDVDNLNVEEYNFLFKQASFWDQVDAENILVFQTDTVLCSNALTSINDFMGFPYIGCSGLTRFIGSHSPWRGRPPFYGVGGLSFRKKSAMMSCINSNPNIDPITPEDVFFSKCAHESPDRATDAKQLASFCTQYEFSENSFGAHKINGNLNKTDLDLFLDYCPEANILLD